MTRLDDFYKLRGDNFFSNVALIFGDLLGYFLNIALKKRLLWVLFGDIY